MTLADATAHGQGQANKQISLFTSQTTSIIKARQVYYLIGTGCHKDLSSLNRVYFRYTKCPYSGKM